MASTSAVKGSDVILTITGDFAVAEKLLALSSKAQMKTACNKALGAGAKIVNRAARVRIRERTKRRTGRLRVGTEITRIVATRQGNWKRRVQLKGREFFGIEGKQEYYPAIVEYGHDKAPGKHFMRDAHRDTKTEVTAAIETALADYVNKQAGT